MLTEKEKECFRDLLERIELRDLITLTDTVTNRVVSAENRQEAVEAVLLYSVNAVQLLRRKKVKREHLYHYLAEKGSIEPITADKPYLCRRILELWGSADSEIVGDLDDDTNENKPQTADQSKTTTFTTSTGVNNQVAVSPIDGQTLAEHFTPWFYGLLNSLVGDSNISCTSTNADNAWGHHHFWSDAKCSITMLSEQHTQDECQGSETVSAKLAEMVSKEQLFFNVNVASIKGKLDQYGLVRIIAGGTVHRFNHCIGIFEQSFGLIRDPQMMNNWKIKFTNLRLKSQGQLQGSETPSLVGPDTGPLALRSIK